MTDSSSASQSNVDINQIATDLNGKADVDLVNLSDTGMSKGGGLAFPSNRIVDLGTSIREYTAPANGYFGVHAELQGATGSFACYAAITIDGTEVGRQCLTTYSYSYGGCFLPVPKGAVITLLVEPNVSIQYIRFTYAEGSKNK